MMKSLIWICFIVVASYEVAFAQDIPTKLKQDKVIHNKNHVLDYAYFKSRKEVYLYPKSSNNDVAIIQLHGGKTADDKDNFYFIYFEDIKQSLETREYATYPRNYIVHLLFKEGVFDEFGNFNAQNALAFIEKYNENLHELRNPM